MRLTLLSIIALLLYSCQNDVARQRDAVEKLIGQEIVIPDSLGWRIQETRIPYDTDRADYKVLTLAGIGIYLAQSSDKNADPYSDLLLANAETLSENESSFQLLPRCMCRMEWQ